LILFGGSCKILYIKDIVFSRYSVADCSGSDLTWLLHAKVNNVTAVSAMISLANFIDPLPMPYEFRKIYDFVSGASRCRMSLAWPEQYLPATVIHHGGIINRSGQMQGSHYKAPPSAFHPLPPLRSGAFHHPA
jgi:hypothetical protein